MTAFILCTGNRNNFELRHSNIRLSITSTPDLLLITFTIDHLPYLSSSYSIFLLEINSSSSKIQGRKDERLDQQDGNLNEREQEKLDYSYWIEKVEVALRWRRNTGRKWKRNRETLLKSVIKSDEIFNLVRLNPPLLSNIVLKLIAFHLSFIGSVNQTFLDKSIPSPKIRLKQSRHEASWWRSRYYDELERTSDGNTITKNELRGNWRRSKSILLGLRLLGGSVHHERVTKEWNWRGGSHQPVNLRWIDFRIFELLTFCEYLFFFLLSAHPELNSSFHFPIPFSLIVQVQSVNRELLDKSLSESTSQLDLLLKRDHRTWAGKGV